MLGRPAFLSACVEVIEACGRYAKVVWVVEGSGRGGVHGD